jgi:hypothetical protein
MRREALEIGSHRARRHHREYESDLLVGSATERTPGAQRQETAIRLLFRSAQILQRTVLSP